MLLIDPGDVRPVARDILADGPVMFLCRDWQAKESALWLWERVEMLRTSDGLIPAELS